MDFISKKNVIEHVNFIRLSVFSFLTGKFSVNYVLPFKEECHRRCSFDKTINFHIAFLNSTSTSLALLYWMLLALTCYWKISCWLARSSINTWSLEEKVENKEYIFQFHISPSGCLGLRVACSVFLARY